MVPLDQLVAELGTICGDEVGASLRSWAESVAAAGPRAAPLMVPGGADKGARKSIHDFFKRPEFWKCLGYQVDTSTVTTDGVSTRGPEDAA